MSNNFDYSVKPSIITIEGYIRRGEVMGYILSIENHVGKDYRQRILQEKKNKMYIEQPYRVILNQKYDELKKAPLRKRKAMKRKYYVPEKINTDKHNVDRPYFTEKGQFVNHII